MTIHIRATTAALLVLASPLLAAQESGLNGCWKMGEARSERQSGKVESAKADCIRGYQGTTLVTACRGGRDVGVYQLSDMTVATYSYHQVGRYVDGNAARVEGGAPRAAAFRVAGNTLHMVLGRSPVVSPDPVVRVQQQLSRLPARDCAGIARYLGAAAEPSTARVP